MHYLPLIERKIASFDQAAALVSALSDIAIPPEVVVFGEIGLSGEVRPVAQPDARLKEASKLGFSAAWMPKAPKKGLSLDSPVQLTEMKYVRDLLQMFAETPKAKSA